MARIYSVKVKVQPTKQTHTSGNTEKPIASVWTVENRFTKTTIKQLSTKHESISSDKSITNSNTDVVTSLDFEKAQHERKRDLRENLFKNILENKKVELNFLKFLRQFHQFQPLFPSCDFFQCVEKLYL